MNYLKGFMGTNTVKFNGYVLNGIYFIAGFKNHLFVKLANDQKEKLNTILINISEKYKDDMLVHLAGKWVFGPFAAKYELWVPGYIFQAPFKTKESAIKASKDLIQEFEKFNNIKPKVCIAIAYGNIEINKKYPLNSDGTAYHKSGRYIDDPNNCLKMINKGEYIKIIE